MIASIRLLFVAATIAVTLMALAILAVAAHTATRDVPKNLPGIHATPGWINQRVTQQTLNATVCVSGWTKTIRPPSSYTGYLKTAQLQYRNLPGTSSDYEEDHFIPLELGGSPFDTRNLWPESYPQAHVTDQMENQLRSELCAGSITLRQARVQIIAYKRSNG